MTEVKIYCDFCSERIDGDADRTRLVLKSGPFRLRTGTADLDACARCWIERIEAQLNPTRPSTTEHVGGQPEKPKRRLPILVNGNH
jgi:hypothetical protein